MMKVVWNKFIPNSCPVTWKTAFAVWPALFTFAVMNSSCLTKASVAISSASSTPTATASDIPQMFTNGTGSTDAGTSVTLSVSSVTPSLGGVNTLIYISGSNFLAGATVTVGGVACISTSVVSTFSISCRTPPNSLGPQDIVVTNPSGSTATLDDGYTYFAAPTVTAVVTDEAPAVPVASAGGSGMIIKITGTNFLEITGPPLSRPTIYVGSNSCTFVSFNGSCVASGVNQVCTEIRCTTPINSSGIKTVTVTNPDNQSSTPFSGYTYQNVGEKIVGGIGHTCALVNGGVKCWGDNTYGQLGNLTTAASLTPVSPADALGATLTSGVQDIAAGDNHTCALTNGIVKCWGNNFYGQIGTSTNAGTNTANTTPVTVSYPTSGTNLTGIRSIVAGGGHTCALSTVRGMLCWGNNQYGQLGNSVNSGTTNPNPIPLSVRRLGSADAKLPANGGLENATEVAAWVKTGTATITHDTNAANRYTPADYFPVATNVASMKWAAYTSHGTAISARVPFSTAEDFSKFHTGVVRFKMDDPTVVVQRTISVILESGTATRTYSLTGNTLSSPFTSGAWVSFYFELDTPTSSGGTGTFSFSSINAATLKLSDSANPTSGTKEVYWDNFELEGDTNILAMTAGGGHTCAVRNGAAFCWGLNSTGQLGDTSSTNLGTTTANPNPLPVNTLTSGVSAISAGYFHTCAIQNGQTYCWGLNNNGQLGDNSNTDRAQPVTTKTAGGATTMSDTVSISAGKLHSCGIQTGAMVCWGLNTYGQLEDNTTTSRINPTTSTNFTSSTQKVFALQDHTCAIKADAAYCWGRNQFGQIGDNTSTNSSTGKLVYGLTSGIHGGVGGYAHSCAIVNSGTSVPTSTVQCWGSNGYGQLGDNTLTDKTVPTRVLMTAGPTYLTAQEITAGLYHTCAINNGAAYCWGYNANAQIGDPAAPAGTNKLPVAVTGGLNSGTKSISAGGYHTCAIKGGAAYCWGSNSSGQLGNNSLTQSAAPVSPIASGVTAIAAGGFHTCAIVNGGVKCWGDNAQGQLGRGSSPGNTLIPIDVAQSATLENLTSGVEAIVAGLFHTCALKNKAVWCWGLNTYGSLGTTTSVASGTNFSNIPVQVNTISAVTQLNSGYFHTCAVSSGSTYCWGHNSYGQIGNSTTVNATSPTLFTGGDSSQSVFAGAYHTCVFKSGSLKCSGYNGFGQLGDNTTTNSTIGVQVKGF